MKYVKTDEPGYVKDEVGFIINTQDTEYQRIIKNRELASENQTLKSTIKSMEAEILEIKALVHAIAKQGQ